MKKVFLWLSFLQTTLYPLMAQKAQSDTLGDVFTTSRNLTSSSQKAQSDTLRMIELEEVVVSGMRAGKNTPVSYTDISALEIKQENAARNIPAILQNTPSLVSFTEDGLGVGNTAFRIRGTDATRINITLNGMPLNNPESQEVYWVNLPDLSNSLQSIQIQRGVGTSSNGSGAFGATISLKTLGGRSQSYGEASTAAGSYATFLSTVAAGSGILKNGLSFDARYSRVWGEGYIRNGKINHHNLYATLSHYSERQLLRLSYLRGEQHTGITWEGVSEKQMNDPVYGRRYNPAGEYFDEAGNRLYYDNETDNYFSDIVQFLFTRELTGHLSLNVNLNWNHGYGYYENYKKEDPIFGKKFSYYGFENQVVDGVTHKRSDLIKRELMENDFYVANAGAEYRKNALKLNGGMMYAFYDGNHYGRLKWVKFNQNIPENHEWYRNKGKKSEFSTFLKAEYQLNLLISLYGDLQYRQIGYRFSGNDKDRAAMDGNLIYRFFNPKAGAFLRLNDRNRLYASVAVGQREPLRSDLKDGMKKDKDGNAAAKITQPERMIDYEVGYRFGNEEGVQYGVNLYLMDYDNQMVQTGRLNDVGYKLMENVKKSYRTGIELEAHLPLWKNRIVIDANATVSRNKIKNYTAYYDLYDNPNDYNDLGKQITKEFVTTNISFSPNVISAAGITYQPVPALRINLVGKYIGKQYLDNTSDDSRSLPSYFVSNFSAGYTFAKSPIGEFQLDFFVNNLFNRKYAANGWAATDAFDNGTTVDYIGFYPQATRNYMARLTLRF